MKRKKIQRSEKKKLCDVICDIIIKITIIKNRNGIKWGDTVMGWTCVVAGCELADIKQDRKNAKGFERYDISEKAVYFEGRYLPVAQIKSVRVQPSVYRPRHSCGVGFPIFKIRLDYGAERPVVLAIESEKKANAAVDMICRANPDIVLENYLDPHTGLKPEKISPPLY